MSKNICALSRACIHEEVICNEAKRTMSILKFVMQKILLLCKTETKPKHNASTYHLPPC